MTSHQRTVEWERFGLDKETNDEATERSKLRNDKGAEAFYTGNEEELFSKEEGHKPWWLISLLLSQRTLFGTWDGVFTSCMVNLLGAILFLRTGWIVSQAGIVHSILIISVSVIILVSTTLSVVGILSLTQVESGGVYFLVSHVLGSRIGGAIGLTYCFGQIVGVALCLVGFGESMTELLEIENMWVERGFAMGALLVLAIINFSGVKFVIKIQVVLFLFLILSLIDFGIGSFFRHLKEEGITGWSKESWEGNLWSNFSSGYTWFTVLGVFFPSVTGTMAGINMSGDLRTPERDISVGTLSSLLCSFVVYILVVFVLGGTVKREVLRIDSLVMEKVSASGILLLLGVYVSTLSCPLVSLYGTPRVLQSIAGEHVIPLMKPLEMGRGPNKLPVLSLALTVALTFLFLLVGRINVLAPIVAAPFLVTYAAIDYAYFALSVTYSHDLGISTKTPLLASPSFKHETSMGKTDLDQLFPERITRKKVITKSTASSESSSPSDKPSSPVDSKIRSDDPLQDDCMMGEGVEGRNELGNAPSFQVGQKPISWLFNLSNKWVSFLGALVKIGLMFAINWIYGLTGLGVVFLLYYYIATTSPGVPPGIAANFNIFTYIKYLFFKCIGRSTVDCDEIVIPPIHPGVQVKTSALTKENLDFAKRSKFHQSKSYQN